MLSVLTIVAPVFALIAIGFLAARLGYLSAPTAKAVSEFSFKLAMPALMFRTMATAEFPAVSPLGLWASFFGAIAMVWVAAALITRSVLGRSAADGAAIAFSASYGNIVMLGIPLGLSAFGPDAMGPMALLISINSPLMWLVATLHMGLAVREAGLGAAEFCRALALELATNPIILAIVLGLAWRATGVGFSALPDRVLAMLGQAGVPTALIALGLTLAAFRIAGQGPTLATIILLKGIAMPLLAWVLATRIMQLPPLSAAIVVLFAAMPTGANAFLFASRYGRAVNSTSGAIAIGTMLSVLTASLIVYALGAG